jgi:hypothetical protein
MVWPSIISGITAVSVAGLGYYGNKRLREIHVLVNNQLDQVMRKLEASQRETQTLKDEAK